jgi:2'-5' RNA ligase
MEKMNLYFIALIPHQELRDEIREMKDEMKILTGAKNALKSPAHITLQKPFKRGENEEHNIVKALRQFAKQEKPFRVVLSGFGSFPPRVIFIQVKNHQPVIELHARLKKVLIEELEFTPAEIMQDIHPHITLTTRYLTSTGFHEAWPVFENRVFDDSFEAHTLFLLKHNGQKWEIATKFTLGN